MKDSDELQLPENLIFFAVILHTFPTKRCLLKGVGYFLSCLYLELLIKMSKKKDGFCDGV